jgi:hypothetical protein
MKYWLYVAVLVITIPQITGCLGEANSQTAEEPEMVADSPAFRFDPIKDHPTIVDTAAFYDALSDFVYQENDQGPVFSTEMERMGGPVFMDDFDKITHYERVQIYGAEEALIVLEVKFQQSAMVAYPWKTQFVFTASGELMAMFHAEEYATLVVHDRGGAYLMMKMGNARGIDGTTEIYGVKGGELSSAYDGSLVTHEENMDGDMYEMLASAGDKNGDGHNDIVFTGTIVSYSADLGEEKERSVEVVLTFNSETGKFEDAEN